MKKDFCTYFHTGLLTISCGDCHFVKNQKWKEAIQISFMYSLALIIFVVSEKKAFEQRWPPPQYID
jgi:hypothetical protein